MTVCRYWSVDSIASDASASQSAQQQVELASLVQYGRGFTPRRGVSGKSAMQKWEKVLFQMTVVSGAFFVWLISVDVGMLPANFRGGSVLFRWQIWLLASLCLVATRDFVSQIRCRCCGSRERISPLRLLPRRVLLCRNCLGWDSGVHPVEALPLVTGPTATFGLPDALQPFWTRRPSKTWLPSLWISTTRIDLRRRAGGLFAPYRKMVSGMRNT